MNTILLNPTDILFFRDGRPMEGSSAGHGAAWPLPSVLNAAFHAALHRAGIEGAHRHRYVAQGKPNDRDRLFGSLVTAGPFPVQRTGANGSDVRWYYPRPLDLGDNTTEPALCPAPGDWHSGTLPEGLRYAVANRLAPSKESKAPTWISQEDYSAYLRGEHRQVAFGLSDSQIGETEHAVGIAIDPATQTTGQGDAKGKIYSAHYLRLLPSFQLGMFGEALDKVNDSANERRDLLAALLGTDGEILVGGQQRVCTARVVPATKLPIPQGLTSGFHVTREGRVLVKWVLLTPSVWPRIQAGTSREGTPIREHSGGWLPNWIDPKTGAVLLKHRSGEIRRIGRKRTASSEHAIAANLVAAIVPKPTVVTGWSTGAEPGEEGGAKSTHLAVPAGAVYYFEAADQTEAERLASALNWHGSDADGGTIRNRRSTLMGEKGFGLGVCGTWQLFADIPGHPHA